MNCPNCGKPVTAVPDEGKRTVECPNCHYEVTVKQTPPSTPPDSTATNESFIYCQKCGTRNNANNYRCTKCGEIIQMEQRQPAVVVTDTMGGWIPSQNPKAVWAYYLGIFSIIPCLGIASGITALILGIMGLKDFQEKPEIKGKTHAWTGILAGGGFSLLWTMSILIALAFEMAE
ncbi:hypothetical protein JW979_01540 [bacterium]|nr:hypothetical protein [candidate division CSSED10-310 bacterium]